MATVTETAPAIFGVERDGPRLLVYLTGLRAGMALTANLGTVESVQPSMPGVWIAELTLTADPAELIITTAGVPSLPYPLN